MMPLRGWRWRARPAGRRRWPSVIVPAVDPGGDHAAGQRHREAEEGDERPAASCAKAAWSSRKMPSAAARPKTEQPRSASVLGRGSRRAPRRGTRAGSRPLASRSCTSLATAPASRPLDVGGDVEAAGDVLALDDVGRRADPDVGDVAEADVAAGRACRSAGSRCRSGCGGPRACPRPRPRRPSGPRRGCRPGCPTAAWPRPGGRRRA